MPGCCVPGCSNCTEKGFSMRSFPSDKTRKALWIEHINNIHRGHQLSKWQPAKNSFVCEVSNKLCMIKNRYVIVILNNFCRLTFQQKCGRKYEQMGKKN